MKPFVFMLLLLIFIGGVNAKIIDSTKRIQANPTTGLIAFNGLAPTTISRDNPTNYVSITSGAWMLGFRPALNQTITLTGLNATTLTYTVNTLANHFIFSPTAPTGASTPIFYNVTSTTITVLATAPTIWITWAPILPSSSIPYWLIIVFTAALILFKLSRR